MKPLKYAVSVDNFRQRKDRSVSLYFTTNTELSSNEVKELVDIWGTEAWLVIAPIETKKIEIPREAEFKYKADEKPYYQRYKDVLYVFYEQNASVREKYRTYREFYEVTMEKNINSVKEKLN